MKFVDTLIHILPYNADYIGQCTKDQNHTTYIIEYPHFCKEGGLHMTSLKLPNLFTLFFHFANLNRQLNGMIKKALMNMHYTLDMYEIKMLLLHLTY